MHIPFVFSRNTVAGLSARQCWPLPLNHGSGTRWRGWWWWPDCTFFIQTYLCARILTIYSASRRVLLGSFKKLQVDDALMICVMVRCDAQIALGTYITERFMLTPRPGYRHSSHSRHEHRIDDQQQPHWSRSPHRTYPWCCQRKGVWLEDGSARGTDANPNYLDGEGLSLNYVWPFDVSPSRKPISSKCFKLTYYLQYKHGTTQIC